jgi:hypothetical protein
MRNLKPMQMTEQQQAIRELTRIPGVGKSIAQDLWHIGICTVAQLKEKNPQNLYAQSNAYAGIQQDRCLLYVFRCAVYFAETEEKPNQRMPELLKWWNWKEQTINEPDHQPVSF